MRMYWLVNRFLKQIAIGGIMEEFATLSIEQQVTRIHQLALTALSRYGLKRPEVLLVQHSMNTIFAVTDLHGEIGERDAKYVLRVHPGSWLCPAQIASEPVFLAAAYNAGLPVSCPVMGFDGQFMQLVTDDGMLGSRCTMLFHWMEGEILSKPLNGDTLLTAGRLIAKLHDFSKSWIPPDGFWRPSLRADNLFCASGMFDPKGGRGLFSPSQADVFSATIEKIA
jgi:Ser/Thr protein kinase RdoA (MazF antagonist)